MRNRADFRNRGNWANRGGYWNRGSRWYGGGGRGHWGRGWGDNGVWLGYYPRLHRGWYHGGWSWWTYPYYSWYGGTPLEWLLGPSATILYDNPYYVAPVDTTVVTPWLDYANPIPVPVSAEELAPAEVPAPLESDEAVETAEGIAKQDQANRLLEQARAYFADGDYPAAQYEVENAIKLVPGDPALHEFRALTLFAQRKYQEAAAAVYAVLAANPGWDWATMIGFYSDPGVYTDQLRALESYVRRHRNDAAATFLLAYHYLVQGAINDAIDMLQRTVDLEPNDALSAELLKSLQDTEAGQ